MRARRSGRGAALPPLRGPVRCLSPQPPPHDGHAPAPIEVIIEGGREGALRHPQRPAARFQRLVVCVAPAVVGGHRVEGVPKEVHHAGGGRPKPRRRAGGGRARLGEREGTWGWRPRRRRRAGRGGRRLQGVGVGVGGGPASGRSRSTQAHWLLGGARERAIAEHAGTLAVALLRHASCLLVWRMLSWSFSRLQRTPWRVRKLLSSVLPTPPTEQMYTSRSKEGSLRQPSSCCTFGLQGRAHAVDGGGRGLACKRVWGLRRRHEAAGRRRGCVGHTALP
jgi:hypothetical protein